MGAFPEDEEILATKLIMLWVAEGFIKTSGSKSSEEVAEEYLEDLVDRNLVMMARKRPNGKIKTCMIHDLMRELSIRKAQQVKFFQHLNDRYIDRNDSQKILKNKRISVTRKFILSFREHTGKTHVRSLLYFSADAVYPPSIARHFRKLRVLDGVSAKEDSKLSDIYELSNLRYLHIILELPNHFPARIPKSISKLQNLETLIFSSFDAGDLVLPLDIWKMPQLKHFFCAPYTTLLFTQSYCVLDNLQSLSNVRDIRFTKCFIERTPNLKTLKVINVIDWASSWDDFCLSNLVDLHKLEELNVSISWGDLSLIRELAFPQNLKTLTLHDTKFPWDLEMSLIGSLPNLQVLNLLFNSFIGEEWESIEGQFLQLKYLKLSYLNNLRFWRVESTHFPCLETLIIEWCGDLQEVPSGIGEIDTLQKLIIRGCSENVNESARRIQEEQETYGNYALQIVVLPR